MSVKMNLRLSVGCYSFIIYFVFFASSYQLRGRKLNGDGRSHFEKSKLVTRVREHPGLRVTIKTNPRGILESLKFKDVHVKPSAERNENNPFKWEWVPRHVGIPKRRVIVPQNHGQLLESHTLTDEMIDELADLYVKFYLYTKKNPIYPQVLTVDGRKALRKSNFQGNVTTVFVTHGWINTANVASLTSIRDAYLNGMEEVNVIAVDWSSFSKSLYNWSGEKVIKVGIRIARMIDFLQTSAKLRLNSTTLVGHSLGAHIMGVAGKKTNGMINQIFGLDPTRPSFLETDLHYRLSRKSARNVQVIHTDGNNLGLFKPLGHADFYPNGGSNQPGCSATDVYTNGGCSHAQSFWFFAESLNSPIGFKAVRCKRGENPLKGECSGKVNLMGGRSNNINVTGNYYLETCNTAPYALELQQKIGNH